MDYDDTSKTVYEDKPHFFFRNIGIYLPYEHSLKNKKIIVHFKSLH